MVPMPHGATRRRYGLQVVEWIAGHIWLASITWEGQGRLLLTQCCVCTVAEQSFWFPFALSIELQYVWICIYSSVWGWILWWVLEQQAATLGGRVWYWFLSSEAKMWHHMQGWWVEMSQRGVLHNRRWPRGDHCPINQKWLHLEPTICDSCSYIWVAGHTRVTCAPPRVVSVRGHSAARHNLQSVPLIPHSLFYMTLD